MTAGIRLVKMEERVTTLSTHIIVPVPTCLMEPIVKTTTVRIYNVIH